MHNLNEKVCPLMGKNCLLKNCTFFNEYLDGCEFSILNYNLYQLKEHIRAWLKNSNTMLVSPGPAESIERPGGPRFPRPVR